MPKVNIVVDDVPEGGFLPLPEDETYSIEVSVAEARRSVKGPYLNLQTKVVDHPVHHNYTIFEILPVPDPDVLESIAAMPEIDAKTIQDKKDALDKQLKRCFRTRQACAAFGVNGKTPLTEDALTKELPGRRAQIKVKTEEYQGNARSRIKYYLPRK